MATTVSLKPNAVEISGSTSGTTTLQATAVAGTTTLTLPAATDTLVGKATTDTLTNKTLTGAAMNGTLGATTPSTVAATTLTTSSTVTHNGGTANGVPYLNGSKVLTTGSALVFDGSNLGVGVTPTTGWYSLIKANQTLSASFAGLTSGTTYVTYVGSNWFVNTVAADKYIANGFASLYTQASGQHQWSTAGSNSSGAGAALTFTQAMTLDASGNLGVGVTAPQNKLQVVTTTRPQFSVSYDGTTGLYLEDSTASVGKSWKIATSTAVASALEFYQSTATSGVPTWAATAAMTLDASGALLVGATALTPQTGKFKVVHDTGNQNIASYINSAASSPYGNVISFTGASPNNTTNYFLVNVDSTTSCFTIWSNGTTSGRSDARLKKNIADATPKLNDICQLQVRNYEWVESDGGQKEIGLIAQEVEQVFPGLVITHDLEKYGDDYKEVKYSAFVPILIKAIQEQQALITTLTARITALESA